uniref:ATP synthase complex subunit 8 n=1 Tax=Phlogotettix sp. EMHAU-2015-Zz052705 TaxID=2038639 RepID=A0A343K5W5_9HEMI|nr:ATP synthase F0 subunit 8 [Phlogotettix sp. EMHAU-2015-Zz052705]
MPQMAPMWWFSIMMLTIIMLIITMMINYFNSIKIIKKKSNMKLKKMSWTW